MVEKASSKTHKAPLGKASDKPFAGKIALVTGGSRGIGRAICLKLATLGAEVIVNYARRDEDALRTVADIEAVGGAGHVAKANLGNLEEIHELFEQIRREYGGLDILVNSAARGLERPRPALAALPQHLRNTFEMNVLGPWFATKAAAALMEERGGGAIVNMTSLGAGRYMPNYAAVGVTKGALDSLTTYLAVELAPKGIRVNAVCPSWVDETSGVVPLPDAYGEMLRKATPAGRHVSPEDVANAVAFLCSADAVMIVGHSLVIDGGLTLLGLIQSPAGEQ